MQIQIHTPELSLSEQEKHYIEDKVAKLAHFGKRLGDESSMIKVEMTSKRMKTAGNGVNCQVTMYVPGAVIRGEVRAKGIKEAIDLAIGKLKRQLEKYKVTLKDKKKKGQKIQPTMIEMVQDYTKERLPVGLGDKIARRKIFNETKPLHEEEAVHQMELLGHKFFMFLNETTGRYSVAYKREEGNYGVIELER